MVAYNFQNQFAGPIQAGKKTHTIRSNGKRRHARPGESLQLYTGMRTASCKRILASDPVCVDTYHVVIDINADSIGCVSIGGVCVKSIDQFAKQDGFASAADMHRFWVKFHGIGKFNGTLIEWETTS